jgi:ATP-dependent DNA ligase
LTDGNDYIKIFSKSGKDSTGDPVRLHGALKDCLGISAGEGRIKKHCILEGELLVWNRGTKAVEPFHKIRKHVQRSGRWLDNQADSPASLDEHLMIMFYDILLLDDNILLREPHDKRRRRLQSLVKTTPGWAEIGTREKINFSSLRAPEQLRAAFAAAITQHWEGFVLKGCDEPYLTSNGSGRCIKLKKDYIIGLGGTADFAIVGGRRDSKIEQKLGLGRLSWTSFYIGCLENKAEFQRFDTKPVFRIVEVVGEHNISKDDILFLNERGKFVQVPFSACREELEVKIDQRSLARPTELFKQAFVAEIYSAGFDKPADTRSFTLRFPRVLKIHSDRPVSETVSFEELQRLGQASHQAPTDTESQKDRDWIERLEKADPKSRYVIEKSQSTTPGRSSGSTGTGSTTVTPNMRTKYCSPILVRADTNELLSTELSEREQTESSGIFYSQSPRQDIVAGSKRKLLSADVPPEVTVSSKRVKFLKLAHSAPRPGGRQLDPSLAQRKIISSPCEGVRGGRDATAQVGLKTTPPWCKWSGQFEPSPTPPRRSTELVDSQTTESRRPAEAHMRSMVKPGSSSREPLADITNASPEHTRPPVAPAAQHSINRANERGSPILGPASTLRKRLEEAALERTQLHHLVANVAVLPTPPTSSPVDAEARASRRIAKLSKAVPSSSILQQDRPVAGARRQSAEGPATGVLPSCQPQATSKLRVATAPPASTGRRRLFAASPVLLGRSLARLSASSARPLGILLRNTAAAFTYSTEYFFSTLAASASPESEVAHVVLIDIARPDSVAWEMKKILQEMKKMVARGTSTQNGCVIFIDWNALQTTGKDTARMALNDLKGHFGGCLAWNPETEGHANESLRKISTESIWSWDEAMTFGT